MSDDFSIFDSASSQDRGEFFKFDKQGDRVEGTYIDVREAIDSFNNEQIIYVLMDRKNGNKIWNVGIRKWNVGVIDIMKATRLGQIVGFWHDGQKESKKTKRMFNDIKVAADPRFFDKEWLEQQKTIEKAFEGMPRASEVTPRKETEDFGDFQDAPSNAQPLQTGVAQSPSQADEGPAVDPGNMTMDSILAVRALARSKGLVTEGMSDADADRAIVAYTGLEYAQENLTSIIVKLTAYTR